MRRNVKTNARGISKHGPKEDQLSKVWRSWRPTHAQMALLVDEARSLHAIWALIDWEVRPSADSGARKCGSEFVPKCSGAHRTDGCGASLRWSMHCQVRLALVDVEVHACPNGPAARRCGRRVTRDYNQNSSIFIFSALADDGRNKQKHVEGSCHLLQ